MGPAGGRIGANKTRVAGQGGPAGGVRLWQGQRGESECGGVGGGRQGGNGWGEEWEWHFSN